MSADFFRYSMPSLGAISIARKAGAAFADKVEDALAGLLINGIPPGSIGVQWHPDRTVITVDGNPRYEFKIVFEAHGTELA